MLKVIDRLKYEPALFIGFLLSVAALVFKVVAGGEIRYEDVVLILTPLGTGMAVRPKVRSKKFIDDNVAGMKIPTEVHEK